MKITKTKLDYSCNKVVMSNRCGSWSLKHNEYYYCEECWNKHFKTTNSVDISSN
jgi:hypothetical protein